jgi:hypothetical protein
MKLDRVTHHPDKLFKSLTSLWKCDGHEEFPSSYPLRVVMEMAASALQDSTLWCGRWGGTVQSISTGFARGVGWMNEKARGVLSHRSTQLINETVDLRGWLRGNRRQKGMAQGLNYATNQKKMSTEDASHFLWDFTHLFHLCRIFKWEWRFRTIWMKRTSSRNLNKARKPTQRQMTNQKAVTFRETFQRHPKSRQSLNSFTVILTES